MTETNIRHDTNNIKSFREMPRSGVSHLARLSTITPKLIMSHGKWIVFKCKIQGYIFLV